MKVDEYTDSSVIGKQLGGGKMVILHFLELGKNQITGESTLFSSL